MPSQTIGHVVYTPPTSEADLSANFKTMYDSQALYLLVDVTDDRSDARFRRVLAR